MLKFDLHTHTTASDGANSPSELIELAKKADISVISITDHDTIDALSEGMKKAKELSIKFIPGVEMNADFETEMHILLYGFDIQNTILTDMMKKVANFRIYRNRKMVDMVADLGLDITYEEVEKAAGEGSICRIHIAEVLMNKGYIANIKEGFKKYLGVGRPAYFTKQLLSPKEVIDFATSIGAITSLAHPKYLNLNDDALEKLIIELKNNGLWGVECYYSEHSEEETSKYLKLCKKHNLNVTAGSDFHGENKPHISLGKFSNSDCPEYTLPLTLTK